jgi:DNA-binding HxlR family transcriptional regulator
MGSPPAAPAAAAADSAVSTTDPATPSTNAIGAALGLLGDEWTLLIVRAAFEGARRYGDWKAALPISDAVLSARLTRLVDAGVLSRSASDGSPSRPSYALTECGLDLWRLLLCIWDWERRHVEGQADRLPSMVHAECGRTFHPVLRCGSCHGPATADDVDSRFGASGSFERSVPVGATRRRSAGRETAGRDTAGRPQSAGPGMFADTMAIIGSRWSSAVLGAAFLGARRFRDFEQIGAPPSIVSDRLRDFVELGVLDRSSDDGVSYRLSAKGSAFFPAVVAFLLWGERWRPAPDGPAVVATHRVCGAWFVPELACSACHRIVESRSLQIVP